MIKLKTLTYYEGKRYNKGDQCSLPEEVEKRWIKNGIAELIPTGDKSKPANSDRKKSQDSTKKSNIVSE